MEMKHDIKWKALLPSLAIPLATGGLSAFLTRDGMRRFNSLAKPPLSPPQWLFPVAWTALYLMMGTACYLVWVSDASPARNERALTVYGLSLAANFLCPILFFTHGVDRVLTSPWFLMSVGIVVVLFVVFVSVSSSYNKKKRRNQKSE